MQGNRRRSRHFRRLQRPNPFLVRSWTHESETHQPFWRFQGPPAFAREALHPYGRSANSPSVGSYSTISSRATTIISSAEVAGVCE